MDPSLKIAKRIEQRNVWRPPPGGGPPHPFAPAADRYQDHQEARYRDRVGGLRVRGQLAVNYPPSSSVPCRPP